jgi:hypothetical protein
MWTVRRRRSMTFGQGMEWVVEGFELVGVAILALGALAAIVRGAIAYARGESKGCTSASAVKSDGRSCLASRSSSSRTSC